MRRIRKSTIPISDITAETVAADGVALRQADHTGMTQRTYSYDTLGRPLTRSTARKGTTVNDTFSYSNCSELTEATVSGAAYSYAYDNIGNRKSAQEAAEEATAYTANALNQYTAIQQGTEEAFVPIYDADGNQTQVKTSTGIWDLAYNAENRPITFPNNESNRVIECAYDSMGRRATKKVTNNGEITLHQRYIYRAYLQIACCDLTRANHPCLWLITWDPTQPIAIRPLVIQKDGTQYCYGWDLTKNICEVFGSNGYINTIYTYTPYGEATSSGSTTQPLQWSSEFYDTELGLAYYNYRHYNPSEGRWLGRDIVSERHPERLLEYAKNLPNLLTDILGLSTEITDIPGIMEKKGWVYAAKAMRKWLGMSGENNGSPMYVPLSWINEYADYKEKFEEIKNISTSKAALNLLAKRLSDKKEGDIFPEPFDNMTLEIHKKYHIQTLSVNLWPTFNSDNFTDQYATLGRFAFHALGYGFIYKEENKKKACLTDIGYYAKDNYSFDDKGQSLGYWDKETNTVAWWSILGNGRSFSNDDFIDYKKKQNNKNIGNNFDIFSDIKKEKLAHRISINI